MHQHEVPVPEAGHGPPRPTVGAIARAHGEALKRQHALTEAQRKVLRDVAACRTPVLGGQVDVCTQCGDEKTVFHSCSNAKRFVIFLASWCGACVASVIRSATPNGVSP